MNLFDFAGTPLPSPVQAAVHPAVRRAAQTLAAERRRAKASPAAPPAAPAQAARDAGITRVSANNLSWLDQALALLPSLSLSCERVTGEQIRLWLSERMDEGPAHHNGWGALVMVAVRRGLLTPTGEHEAMRTTKSHARKTPVYRVGKGAM